MTTLARKDVPKEQTWNSEVVYPTWGDWQKDFELALFEIEKLAEYPGTLVQGPERLVAFLKEIETQHHRVMRLDRFADMHIMVDSEDVEAKSYFGQAQDLNSKFKTAVAFFEPEILALGNDVIAWVDKEPSLAPYKHYLHNIVRLKPHMHSKEVEEILGPVENLFQGPMTTYTELTSADMKLENVVDSDGKTYAFNQSPNNDNTDPVLRKSKYESWYNWKANVENSLAANYLSFIKQCDFIAKTRGYESILAHRLAPSNTPVEVFHTFIDTFKKNLPTWHKYWDVKRKLIGQEKIHPYDVWVQISKEPPVIPYEQAVEWLSEALAPLGDEYVSVMRKGLLKDRWVDWAPNDSKNIGARSTLQLDNYPPFIYMFYQNSIFDMSALAHEIGHSMHFYFGYHHAPKIYSDPDLGSGTVWETASNFNQAMLRAYLMRAKADDPQFQLAILDEAMWNYHRYFFIMPTLSRLEFEIATRVRNGQAVSLADMKSLMLEYFSEGYADTMTHDPDRTSLEWTNYLHLYLPFYTFQYGIGISAAAALSQQILVDQDNAVENYLNFLKAGQSKSTMDLFNLAGIDMTSPEPVRAAFKILGDMVDQLDELIT
jgi:oligoendopeptidase F